MEIIFTQQEIKIIKIWADNNIHGGHWGDGDVMVPEEEILLKKIYEMTDGRLNLRKNEAKLILTWSESSHGIYTLEEDSIIKKIQMLAEKNTGKLR